jgi:hypothetical protein
MSLVTILACIGGGLYMFVSSKSRSIPETTAEVAPEPVSAVDTDTDAEEKARARAISSAMKWGVKVIPN